MVSMMGILSGAARLLVDVRQTVPTPEAEVDRRGFDRAAGMRSTDWPSSLSERGAAMRLDELKSSDAVLDESLRDPGFRKEWDETALARAVAIKLVEYRAQHEMTQTALAHKLGMKQPAVARLESGDHNPSIETLGRLARELGIEFHIDVTPEGLAV
jgi:DNA-binding XRE family transcriptional regulator